ncbi:FkbM family methyltransferase [Mycobacterium haemophilum]
MSGIGKEAKKLVRLLMPSHQPMQAADEDMMASTQSSIFFAVLRGIVRALMTDKTRLSKSEKQIRAALMRPVWGLMCGLLRARLAIIGPLRVESEVQGGDRFFCDLPDSIPLHLYTFGVWEPDVSEFIRSRLSPGDVFVDVGANVGYHTLLGARAVGDRGGVVSIEASPAMFDRLCETVRLNGELAQVRLINNAVSDTPGMLGVYAGPETMTGLTTTVPRVGMPKIGEVAARPLGDLLTADEIRRTRLIKIDVEGGEIAVLKGLLLCADEMPYDVEIAVELSPVWWPDRTQTAAEVLQPWIQRGFNVYLNTNSYLPQRFLWPKAIDRPARVRDEICLRRWVPQLDVVLSRADASVL